MKQLTALDAGFLYAETPRNPMHIASLLLLDPTDAAPAFSFGRFRDLVRSRLDRSPTFRRRLVAMPLNLEHPLWLDDARFNVDLHLHCTRLDAPGGQAELFEMTNRIVSEPLPRDRPLWELWYIDGCDSGQVGVLVKVHHAAIDGMSAAALILALLDLDAATDEPLTPCSWQPEPPLDQTDLLCLGVSSLARHGWRAIEATRCSLGTLSRLRSRGRADSPAADESAPPFHAPRTSFNRAVTPDRAVATATMSLSEVRRVKTSLGVTVNDLVLAVCAGAVDHLLTDQGEDPDGSLIAMVPISTRTEDQNRPEGNRFTMALVDLATDRDDPLERVRAIADATIGARRQVDGNGRVGLDEWIDAAPPPLLGLAAKLYSSLRIADHHRPVFNLIISNVPGPPFPLYVAGARVMSAFPFGPIFDGVGINLTVISYCDELHFGVVVCPDQIPDPWVIADALHTSLDALSKCCVTANV